MLRRLNVSLVLAAFCAAFLSGCGHYQLGTTGKLTFSTIYVEPVKDSANIPQASALFSTQLRQTLLRDSRIQLSNSPESADVTLSVDLRSYDRRLATSRRDDTGLARSFDINISAVCNLRDNRTGQMLFEHRSVEATREIFTSDAPSEFAPDGSPIFVSRQLQAEYQTLPLLAESLADRVSHAVLDVW
ncbi:MAG TPA: LPS assembly lipoprotein LptE [Opitutaceae bacterium]|nr:LPS assembly lipoprotein LptE [Opitutaceae bacterium]